MGLFPEAVSPPSTCVHCHKQIVLEAGTDRYRSTEHGMAVDRMKCEEASDGHHQPAETRRMRRIVTQAPPRAPEIWTGEPT